ncbi:MAG: glutaredoxin domain-containing protein [Actinomycetes bacterium]
MEATSGITMYGAAWCGDCRRSKRYFDANQVSYTYIDSEKDLTAADKIVEISGVQGIPLIIFPDGTHMTEPSDQDLKAKLETLAIL